MEGGALGNFVRGKNCVLELGSVFEYMSVFTGGETGGGVLAVALRHGPSPRSFHVRPLAAENLFMKWHLFERDDAPTTILIRMAVKVGDLAAEKLDGDEVEMVSAYRVFSVGEEYFDPAELTWLVEPDHARIKRDVLFTKDMLAGEPVQQREVRMEEDESPLIKLNKWEFSEVTRFWFVVVVSVLVWFGCKFVYCVWR
jgi:hypothetical protein